MFLLFLLSCHSSPFLSFPFLSPPLSSPLLSRALLFPEDQRMEVNHWAESGELSTNELHQMKVLIPPEQSFTSLPF